MQTAVQELGYNTANVSSIGLPGYKTQAADVLQALAEATTKDRMAATNLSHSNGLFNEQVTNLSKTITAKDTKIDKLHKSISKLLCTIQNL
eukprot:10713413-Ditylum_brightwellii.AAC.1